MDMDGELGEVGEPTPLKASVCDVRIWDITPDAKDMDVQVVRTGSGATVVSVPKDGGAVRAFRLDHRGDLIDRDVATLRDDRNYTGVSASVVGDRFVVASVVGDTVAYDMISDDLVQRHPLGEASGTLVTDTPVLTSRANHIALVGGHEGVTASAFTTLTWEPAAPTTVTKDAVVSITAAPFITDTIFAWSTASKECHVQRFAGKQESMQPFGCNDARLAMDEASLRGQLVHVEDGILYRSTIVVGGENMIANRVQIAEGATSPRVVFDGARFWVSYLDAHGTIIVGFVDDKGRLVSRSLEGLLPDAEAYDLAVFGDGPWIVDTHATAFGALRMCAKN